MNKGIKAGIIVAVIAIGMGLASPLFYETTVDEPLPAACVVAQIDRIAFFS